MVNEIVSVLFNEPKLLKCPICTASAATGSGFSALQRAEIAEIDWCELLKEQYCTVSVLFNEPKLLKFNDAESDALFPSEVSVLFNEPKLLKSYCCCVSAAPQRVSVLFNEPKLLKCEGFAAAPSY